MYSPIFPQSNGLPIARQQCGNEMVLKGLIASDFAIFLFLGFYYGIAWFVWPVLILIDILGFYGVHTLRRGVLLAFVILKSIFIGLF